MFLEQGWALEKSLGATKFGLGPLYIYILIYIIILYIYIFFVWHRGPQLALEHPSAHPCFRMTKKRLKLEGNLKYYKNQG